MGGRTKQTPLALIGVVIAPEVVSLQEQEDEAAGSIAD
jgi:hypothetical protein